MPVEGGAQIARGGILRTVEGDRVDAGDLVVAVGGEVDAAQSRTERHLVAGFEPQIGEDQHPVVLQRLEHRRTELVVVDQPFRLDTDDLGAH